MTATRLAALLAPYSAARQAIAKAVNEAPPLRPEQVAELRAVIHTERAA